MNIKKHILTIPMFLFFLLFSFWEHSLAGSGSTVFIIKSRNIGPYRDVATSAKKELVRYYSDIDIVELACEDDKEIDKVTNEIKTHESKLVIALGTLATKTVRQIPKVPTVVYTMILNPLKSDIGPPGVSMDISCETKIAGIKKVIPYVKSIGMVYSTNYIKSEDINEACNKLGIRLVTRTVDSHKDFFITVDELLKEVDCFLMVADPTVYIPKTTEHLLLEGLQRGVPIVGLSSVYCKAGALMAFDCDYEDLGKQAAELSIKILKGESGALKESWFPRKVRFSLNLKVAERLNIDFPQEIINEAGEVFGR